jgi:hypothetical protein
MKLNPPRTRSLATLITGVALAAAMTSGAGLAAASARRAAHRAAHAAARAAQPAARAAVSGTEHFQLMTTSPSQHTPSTIIATGVFTAGGVDHAGNKADTVTFPGGSFKINHSRGHGKQSFNPKTCLFVISQHGTFKLSSGTGKYAGISGHGTYQLSIMAVAARTAKGACSQKVPPVAWEQIIKASGPVTVK